MRRAAALMLAVVLSIAGLTACDPDDIRPPGKSNVDVDTPELRELKKQAGIEDCVPGTGAPVKDGLPEITLPCFGGGPDINLASLRGPMIVNVWASWCEPCRSELPILQKFFEAHGDQVPVIGLGFGDPQVGQAMAFADESGVRYPLLADVEGVTQGARPFPVAMKMPLQILVREDGTVVVHAEEIETQAELVDLVRTDLGVDL